MSHRAAHTAVRLLAAGPAAFFVLLTTATAQVPAPADPKAGTAKITVEGCLTKERGPQSSSAADLYVLTVPTPATTPAAPSTGGTVPAPALRKMYVLRSASEPPVLLDSFVNHRVKVDGTTTDRATTAPLAGRSPEATPYQAPVGTGSAGAGPTGTPFDRTNLPTLAVSAMTSLASTCR
jgi:hypothetical protein